MIKYVSDYEWIRYYWWVWFLKTCSHFSEKLKDCFPSQHVVEYPGKPSRFCGKRIQNTCLISVKPLLYPESSLFLFSGARHGDRDRVAAVVGYRGVKEMASNERWARHKGQKSDRDKAWGWHSAFAIKYPKGADVTLLHKPLPVKEWHGIAHKPAWGKGTGRLHHFTTLLQVA